MAKGDISWLDPIFIALDRDTNDEKALRRQIVRKLKTGLEDQGYSPKGLLKGVYVIRITGSFMIAYDKCDSPVLYIGRGQAFWRVAMHIKRWAKDVRNFGHDCGLEFRFMLPARRNRPDYFKNVEADLIKMFVKKNGDLPFYNKCRERSFEGKIPYSVNQERMFRRNLGVGQGRRFRWAIKPTPGNRDYTTYWTSSSD
jgi:hypothetical protein